VNDQIGGEPIVVFSRGTRQVATVFSPVVENRQLEFAYIDGKFRDLQTDSVWNLGGVATSGELEHPAGAAPEPAGVLVLDFDIQSERRGVRRVAGCSKYDRVAAIRNNDSDTGGDTW
jgi:hypothetical protein